MLFSDIVKVLDGGFQIAPKAIQPIGLFDKSICWGVLVPDPRPPESGFIKAGSRSPHLLISPIRPDIWPFLLRCEIKLNHAPGCMEKAAQVLVEQGINIQFGECAASGHHHATWNVVAETAYIRRALKAEFEEVLASSKRTVDDLNLRKFTNKLSFQMYKTGLALEKSLIERHIAEPGVTPTTEGVGFLHNRIVQKKLILHDPNSFTEESIKSAAENDLPKAFSFRWMQNLAFFSIYGDVLHPIQFQYNAESSVLVPLEVDSLSEILSETDFVPLPTRAMASIDTFEHYVRLVPIGKNHGMRRLVCVDVHYEVSFSDGEVQEDTSRGLWHSICKKAASKKINILKMANRVKKRGITNEAGIVTLIGESHSEITPPLLESLKQEISNFSFPHARTYKTTPVVKQFPALTAFVSMRINMPRAEEFKRIIKEKAEKWGLELSLVKNPVGQPLTLEVDTTIKNCQGFFQMICFSEKETHTQVEGKKKVLPDLTWLAHEFGVASGCGLPRVRMVDTSIWSIDRWKQVLRIAEDDFLGEINLRTSIEDIQAQVEHAIQMLVKYIRDPMID